MQTIRHRHSIASLVLASVLWLAVGQLAPAAGIEPTGRPTLTLALSQREMGPGSADARGGGPIFPDTKIGNIPQRAWNAPNCWLEGRLFDDAADGKLDEFSTLGAALVAGGVDDSGSLQRYEQKAAVLADELCRSGMLAGTQRQRVEAIFKFLHRQVLRGGYELAYTDLRRVLDDGRFNCLSATVLFNYLAEQSGLNCRAVEMPGHAMSRVVLSDGVLDVETTCPRWFAAKGDSNAKSSGAARPIGAAAVADRSKAREVSPIQLAAMIYYNRGVDLLGEKRFAEAAAANAKALRLDPQNATARGNLLATINNWSIELGNAGQYVQAVDLLRKGLAMDAKFAAFSQNYVHVHRQWVDDLCRQHRYAEASEILERAAAEMPEYDYLRRVQSEVRERWAHETAAAGQPVASSR